MMNSFYPVEWILDYANNLICKKIKSIMTYYIIIYNCKQGRQTGGVDPPSPEGEGIIGLLLPLGFGWYTKYFYVIMGVNYKGNNTKNTFLHMSFQQKIILKCTKFSNFSGRAGPVVPNRPMTSLGFG